MNNLLASRSSVRGRVLASLFGLAALSSLAGCGVVDEPPHIGLVDTAIESDGTLHVVSRIEQSQSEGVATKLYGFTHTSIKGGTTDSRFDTAGAGEISEQGTRMYQLAIDGQGRVVVAMELDEGLVVRRLDAGQWDDVPRDDSLSKDARAELGSAEQLGAAWTASDGAVHVMFGSHIYKVKDTITEHKTLDKPCLLVEDCHFDPQGDEAGEAVSFSWKTLGFELWRLKCEDNCSWETVGPIGSKDQGGSSAALTRSFFHTTDGKGRFLQKVEDTSGAAGDPYKVLVSTLDEQITVFEKGIFRVGGAPRPAGGFVVAAQGYDDQLHLAVVDADGAQKTIELGTVFRASDPLRVRVVGGSNEEVHVIVRESSDHLAHYVVSLPSGEVTKESILVEWEGPTYG